jgi:hypothetical protein
VVLPFLGSRDDALATLTALEALGRGPGDELIVVDNSPGAVAVGAAEGFSGLVISSPVKNSAYAARNVGAERAACDWILFLDADCRPAPTLLDDYFREPPDPRCGAMAGEIEGEPGQRSLAARYARSRSYLSIAVHSAHPHLPMAPTANLLVRRAVFEQVGGFPEGMTAAGGDTYFSWRLQEAGWELCFRPEAVIRHLHRDDLAALVRQTARNAAGAAWLNRHYPGAIHRPSLTGGLLRSALGAAAYALTGRLERARFKLVDALVVSAQAAGRMQGNSAPAAPGPSQAVAVARRFPERGPVSSLRDRLETTGETARVEAVARAGGADWAAARTVPSRFWEDDGAARRFADAGWLVARHPFRCLRDLAGGGSRGEAAPPLSGIAPAVRRLRSHPAAEVWTLGDGSEPLGARLALLAGLPYTTHVR